MEFKNGWELCPKCEHEVEIEGKFEVQICSSCGKPLLPCSLCIHMPCSNCPLEESDNE